MATPFNLVRLMLGCTLAAAMLAACGGSQMAGSALGTTPQTAGAPNSQHSVLPADDGGGCGGGDTKGGLSPNDGGGCCGGGDAKGGLHPNDDGGGCCGGDGGSWVRGTGVHGNDDEGHHHCKNISVSPKVIFFTASQPGPVTVTVKTQTQGTVSELDDCGGASGIATVTQVSTSSDQWTVTAGATQGSCKALYLLKDTSGKRIGHAVLHINNFL